MASREEGGTVPKAKTQRRGADRRDVQTHTPNTTKSTDDRVRAAAREVIQRRERVLRELENH